MNLTILDMNDFDVILGLDWLAHYHAKVDFHIPRVLEFSFMGSSVDEPVRVISAMQARRLLRKSCKRVNRVVGQQWWFKR